jgi:3-deoxy-D-manno-oct-2-ulosonic acid (Kdo) hydroxylase
MTERRSRCGAPVAGFVILLGSERDRRAHRSNVTNSAWITVNDFAPPAGWTDAAAGEVRSRIYCEQLEAGQILFFPDPPFELTQDDRRLLLGQRWSELKLHKNVSYRPAEDRLRGFAGDAESLKRIARVMRGYAAQVADFLSCFLRPYAGQWTPDTASFRPLEEEGRALPLHKRNDLLHVDAFPSRPMHGRRILRVFTNLNPSKPRVWLTTHPFDELARRYAFDAGLREMAASSFAWPRPFEAVARSLGLPGVGRSAYDRFMLRFHDYLKEHAEFQRECPKTRLEFPPLGTWLVMTDGVPHAVLSGQYALEYTAIVPIDALVAPAHAPIRVLEALCSRPLAA